MSNLPTIRFCRTPLTFTDLPPAHQALADHDKDLLPYMGDLCWSFSELLQQCKNHHELRNPSALAQAIILFMEIGLIRTEESAFLEEATTRLERAVDGTFTFQDIRWRGHQLGVRVGGVGNAWVLNATAFSLSSLFRGITNSLESIYTSPENGEQFLLTFTRRTGKSPIDLRRELLSQIKVLADGGGATVEQLQSLLDTHAPPTNPIGLLAAPEEEQRYPWVRWFGDHFICLRCMSEEPIEPATWTSERHADFAQHHERCLPSEPAKAETIVKILRGEERGGEGE